MSHLYIPPCLHLDFVNNSGTIRNGFFQKTANSGYYSNRGRQIENIMYIIDKLGLTQLYLGTYVHYIKNGFQPHFRAFLCLGIKKIETVFRMANENVRFFSPLFSYKNTTTF